MSERPPAQHPFDDSDEDETAGHAQLDEEPRPDETLEEDDE